MATSKQELVVEVTTKADAAKRDLAELDKQAKELGDKPIEIPVKPVDLPGADETRQKVDGLSRSAEGSRNAFANLVGNAGQDLTGMLGPLGSVGVAIGQVAEYTSDAALGGESMRTALAGAAAMALPMAGLSAALLVVTNLVQDYQKRQAEIKKAQQEGTKAFEDATGAVEKWGTALDEAFSAGTADKIETLNKVIKDALGKETTSDVLQNLSAIGKTADDLGETMLAVDQNFKAYAVGQLTAAGVTEKTAEEMVHLIKSTDNASHAIGQMSDTGIDVDKMGVRDLVTGLAELNGEARKQDFEKYADTALRSAGAIKENAAAVAEARAATTNATDAWQLYEEGQNAAKVAAEENARMAADGAQAVQDAGSIIDQVGRQVEEAYTRQQDAIDKAKRAQDDYLFGIVDLPAETDDVTGAIARLAETQAKNTTETEKGTQTAADKAQADIAAADAARAVVKEATDVINTYEKQGFTSDQAAAAQEALAQSAYDTGIKMGLSADQAQGMADQVRGIPRTWNTDVAIAEQGYNDVKAKKNDLEKDMESTLFIYGVLDRSVLNAINSLPPGSIPSSRAVAPVVPLAAPLGVSALAAPQAVSTASRAATINVNLQGAVVADTFQLQRVVSRAVRQGNRLSGTRRYS